MTKRLYLACQSAAVGMLAWVDHIHHAQLPTPLRAHSQQTVRDDGQLCRTTDPYVATLFGHAQCQLIACNIAKKTDQGIATHQNYRLAVS